MVDVCVVGGGPAGLFSAFYSKGRGLNTILLEADNRLGGRIHLFKHLEIYDIPGQFGITGELYLQGLLKQYQKANIPTYFATFVIEIRHLDTYFEVYTKEQKFQAKTIILATGNGYLQPNVLPIPSDWEPFLRYEFENEAIKQCVAVVGANPMAID